MSAHWSAKRAQKSEKSSARFLRSTSKSLAKNRTACAEKTVCVLKNSTKPSRESVKPQAGANVLSKWSAQNKPKSRRCGVLNYESAPMKPSSSSNSLCARVCDDENSSPQAAREGACYNTMVARPFLSPGAKWSNEFDSASFFNMEIYSRHVFQHAVKETQR